MLGRIDVDGAPGDRRVVLARLAQTYDRALSRFFERRVTVNADVPDLVQDVYLRLSRMPDPAGIEKPEHFLFVTAANVLRDRARRNAARGGGLHDAIDEDLAGSEIPPDRVLEGREAADRLQAVLLELPERTRDVFVLRVLEGMKMAEVASAIGISTRAAEKHQAKALARVTAALEDWRHR
ncbi:sigma-70 family RNA polymerase sigma factor [Sphingomonas sp. H39-1-10]|uniref:RNA polymerase sigma factor n=1 Tax=Sphingomonas TaxID=13687 RepID=UPI00087F1F0E|nr:MULTISPECIES: sigma-70 family RNA polymerase sigma factor [Sphingomonas]MDF0490022.1 sigma-70 family RNA polymerase sigma factor [Sphingomonas pollutisoli]SDA36283.1 RNA polymerase sigma-70 factor, ECF subfamily [Sphingomonas sp. NFR15]